MAYVCPVDGTKVNEPTVRIVAGLVIVLASVGLVFQSPYIFAFLAYDFAVRGFDKRDWSPLRYVGIKLTNLFELKEHLIDAAPKRFAAKVGLLFSVTLVILSFLQLSTSAYVVGEILLLCAFLESVFAYCLGCEVYSLFFKLKAKLA